MAGSDEYEPCETVVEFLQLKGSVGLMALLYEKPRTYSELESEIEITSSTISRRRNDAKYLGLLTVELESDEHGTKHVYTLTELGEYVADRMANKGIISSYYQMRDRQKEIEQKTEEIVGWVADNPTNFIKFDAAREERITPRNDPDGPPPELEEVRAAKEDGDEETDTGGNDGSGSSADEADDQTEAEPGSDESSERPQSPSDRLPDNSTASSESETQGTFDDITTDETDSEQSDDKSDS
jgi:DNA-binding HxlR family transcriptional regulator